LISAPAKAAFQTYPDFSILKSYRNRA